MYSRIIALATTAVVLGTVPAALAASSSPASVFVVHGIPGRDVASTLDPLLPVDVSVSGICLLQGLDFGEIKGPFEIPAGTYAITVSLANTVSPCSNAAVISANVTVKAGETAAVVAALSPSGTPTAYPFGIDFHKLA